MKKSDENEIYLSSSPHFSDKSSTSGIMLAVVIALLPLCVYGVILFGIPALVTIIVSTACCVVFEMLFQMATKQTITIKDCSAIVTGILLALVLPPTTPIWMTMLGSAFSIIVAKSFFGGLGANIFNPALAGRAFMFVSFPSQMGATWLQPSADAISSATVLSTIKAGSFSANTDTYLQYFLGNRAGCIGETSIALILLAFLYLLITRVIDGKATISMVATVALATWLSGGDVVMALISGGLLFGAVFMVTDYATTPVTSWGRIAFGIGCGLITFLIRKFGGYPEGVMFSILIMNAVTPFLNNLTRRKYGYKFGGKA